jgi:hypothetical protein
VAESKSISEKLKLRSDIETRLAKVESFKLGIASWLRSIVDPPVTTAVSLEELKDVGNPQK